jgi:hypothetical protein
MVLGKHATNLVQRRPGAYLCLVLGLPSPTCYIGGPWGHLFLVNKAYLPRTFEERAWPNFCLALGLAAAQLR